MHLNTIFLISIHLFVVVKM